VGGQHRLSGLHRVALLDHEVFAVVLPWEEDVRATAEGDVADAVAASEFVAGLDVGGGCGGRTRPR